MHAWIIHKNEEVWQVVMVKGRDFVSMGRIFHLIPYPYILISCLYCGDLCGHRQISAVQPNKVCPFIKSLGMSGKIGLWNAHTHY